MRGASTRGRLLLATPPLVDPNFDRSVVLMLEHNADGALGLVLNRPTRETSAPGLRAWLDVASEPPVVFSGGPVDSDTYIGLALGSASGTPRPDRSADDPDAGEQSWAPLGDGLATVDLESEPDEVGLDLRSVRIFRGYAGWGPGQLDDELDEGAWIVVTSEHGDAFTSQPDDLWRVVLRRQEGRLAWLANCPDDLSTN